MRAIFIVVLSLVLSACGGGSSSSPPPVPGGSISGTAFDGLILNGVVKVYDFSSGSQGALIASSTTDSKGLYNLSMNVESRPILIEISGGFYIEEAGSNVKIALTTDHKITALVNYSTGVALKVAVTTYTHLAAGLAHYQIKNGKSISAAINDANQRISSWTGINIINTIPKDITDVANASFILSPEHKYGFLAGAISMWTYNHAPSLQTRHIPPYTSINFAQLIYQDISSDGLLDGIAFDNVGAPFQLAFGLIPLNVDVYRTELGASLVQIAAHANNKTGIDGTAVLSYSQNFVTNTDAAFGGAAPKPLLPSTISITSPVMNGFAKGVAKIDTVVTTSYGIKTYELLLNGLPILSSSTAASLQLNTKEYIDGSYNVFVRITDLGGFITTANTVVKIDNTPPTLAGTTLILSPFTLYGTATDGAGSGAVSVQDIGYSNDKSLVTNGGWYLQIPYSATAPYKFRVKDAAGNCNDYVPDIAQGYTDGFGVLHWGVALAGANTCS